MRPRRRGRLQFGLGGGATHGGDLGACGESSFDRFGDRRQERVLLCGAASGTVRHLSDQATVRRIDMAAASLRGQRVQVAPSRLSFLQHYRLIRCSSHRVLATTVRDVR